MWEGLESQRAAAAEDVEVEVKDDLACTPAGVDDEAVAGLGNFFLFGDPASDEEEVPGERFAFGRQLVEAGNVLDGNDEHVDGRARRAVVKGDGALVAVDDVGRGLPGYDSAKDAF